MMSIEWKLPVRIGLLAGVALLYTAVIGMLEAFSDREIIRELVTLSQITLVTAPVAAGFFTVRQMRKAGSVRLPLLFGGIVGAVTALPVLALIFLANQIELQTILVNVNRNLLELLTFQQEDQVTGALLLFAVLTLSGVIGALVELIPHRIRQALFIGALWVISLGALSELVQQILQQAIDRDALRAIYNRDALRPDAAVGIFVLTVTGNFLWSRGLGGQRIRQRLTDMAPGQQQNLRRGSLVVLVVVLLVLPWLVGNAASEILTNVGLYILMGLGLNIAIGLAGLLDLGYVTNFAVGAYVMGVLTSTGPLGVQAQFGISVFNFWLVIPISLLVAMFTGFILAVPVLRMRGDYLAIATLGFGEIIRLLAISDWLKPFIGGAQGILFIPKPQFFGLQLAPQLEIHPLVLNDPQQLYYVILGACLFAIFVSTRLNNSRIGRQWMAVREDEDVAAAMGINTAKSKLLAFTLSAATGGIAGAIFAAKLGTIFPNSFGLLVSINVLSLIIIGGMGSVPGIVVGAFVLIGLPELLREFDEFRLLIYGVLLIVMMLARPEGLWPSAIHRREMHQTEDETDLVPKSARDTTVVATGD